MAENTLNVRFLHAYKTEADWTKADPVPKKGEICFTSDKSGMYKIGNGTDKWSVLPYNHISWNNIDGKPSTFTPSSHTHDLNAMINSLTTATATPTDDDYYVSQYAGGGTTTTTYHRRPISALSNYIKAKLSTVATSGSYNDLSNKPTIGNGTVTIKQGGTSKGSFTMNQSGSTTIELSDNNTWRGIQNNLTSTSTTDSLSAAQGKALKDLVDTLKYSWTATVHGATWSRLCYIAFGGSVTGSSFFLQVSGTRNAVVYNDTFHITVHHSQKSNIVRVNGSSYSSIQIRVVSDSSGNCYIELYDNAKSIATTATQAVYCRLVPMSVGAITKYTVFTSGATLPTNFIVSSSLTTKIDYLSQGSYAGTFSGTLTGSSTSILDSNDKKTITLAYSKTGMNYADYNWLAAWNGYELQAINKNQFATASHTHNYAGSSSAGGSATSAVKLDVSTAGSATQPVYFSGGKPTACTYTLGKSVPSDAKFTDTNTWIALKGATTSADGTAGYAPAPAKGAANRYLRSDGTWAVPPDTNTVYSHPTTSGNKHIPSGGSAGQILRWSADGTAVWGTDNNTTYSAFKGATSNAAGGTGLVPAPAIGNRTQYLRGDGTWGTPTNTVYSHPNSGVTAGTYRSVTVNAAGHVTAGTNPTTLSGYGITDAAAKTHTHAWTDITDYLYPTFSGISMDQYGAYIYSENDGNIKFRYTGTNKDTSTWLYTNIRDISSYVGKIAAHVGQYVMCSDGLHGLSFPSTAANGTATASATISNWNANWYYTYYLVYTSQYFNVTGISLSKGTLSVSGANISNGTHTGAVSVRVLAFSAI